MSSPHFGPRVLGEGAYAEQKHITSVGGHHFGSRVVDLPPVSVPEPATVDIREMNVHTALAHIAGVDASEYPALLEQERAHPKYLGGRRMVLDALTADEPEPAAPAYAISDEGED